MFTPILGIQLKVTRTGTYLPYPAKTCLTDQKLFYTTVPYSEMPGWSGSATLVPWFFCCWRLYLFDVGPMYQHEFWMLGEQTLADLKDRIKCPVDFNIVGKQQVLLIGF